MSQIDAEFQDLAKKGGISRNKFIAAFTGAGLGAEFAGILFDSYDLDGNRYVFDTIRITGSDGQWPQSQDHQGLVFFFLRSLAFLDPNSVLTTPWPSS